MICIMHGVWKGEQEHGIIGMALLICKEENGVGKKGKQRTHTQSGDEQSVLYRAV